MHYMGRIAPPSQPPYHSTPATRDFHLDWSFCLSELGAGEPPPGPLGRENSAGLQQRIGVVVEGGPAHPDDTLRGVLQPWHKGKLEISGCWTSVMKRQEERSNPHRPLTYNTVYPQWSIQSKCQQVIFKLKLVTDNLPIHLFRNQLRNH